MSREANVPLGATDEAFWESDKLNIFIDNLGKDPGGIKHGNDSLNITAKDSLPSSLAPTSVETKITPFTNFALPILHSEGCPASVYTKHKTSN
jgi:hypothetical protein